MKTVLIFVVCFFLACIITAAEKCGADWGD